MNTTDMHPSDVSSLTSVPVKIKRLMHYPDGADLPCYETPGSVGMDLRAAIEEPVELAPGERTLIPSGIAVALPRRYEFQIRPRSGLAYRSAVTVLNSPGTIDADYRGEIKALLINHSKTQVVEITPGERIAQLVIAERITAHWMEVDGLPTDTERGEGGFGSTGTGTGDEPMGTTDPDEVDISDLSFAELCGIIDATDGLTWHVSSHCDPDKGRGHTVL